MERTEDLAESEFKQVFEFIEVNGPKFLREALRP